MENYYEKWLENNLCIADEISVCVRDKDVQNEINQMLLNDDKEEVDFNTMWNWQKNTNIKEIVNRYGYDFLEENIFNSSPDYVYNINL